MRKVLDSKEIPKTMVVTKAPILFLLVLALLMSCSGQTARQKEIYNEQFKWSIRIPAGFENVSEAEEQKIQNKGLSAIEKTYGQPVEDHSKPIFIFKSGPQNYFESNHQPFDEAVDGDYRESFNAVNQIIYETFLTQMQGARFDTVSSTTVIDGLDFYTYTMKITHPKGMVMNFIMYSRLFDKQEFTVNMIYVDEAKGNQMKESWSTSKFKK